MSIGSIMNGINSSLRNHQVANTQHNQSIQIIASGSKYPSASYGPAAYAIIQRTYANIGATEQANTNAQNTNAMLSTASGAAGNAVSMLSSLRSSILEAANDTNGDTDLAALQGTVNQTISGLNDNVDSATYNGMRLVDGSKTVAVQGAYGYTNVQLGNLTSQGLGLMDSEGNSTINLTDKSSLASALDTVDSALNSALDQATTIGAAQQGLGYQSANLTTQAENLYNTVSTAGDTDIAAQATKLASSNTQDQMALWAIKQGMASLSQQTLGALNNHSRGAALSLLS